MPNRLLARWCLVLALSHGYLLGHDTIPCRTRRHGSVSLVVRTSTKSWVASPANPVRNLPLDAAGGFFGVLADIGAANATLRLLPWAKLACTLTYLPALRDVYALFPWSLGSVAAVVRTMAATAALSIFLRAWEFHPFMVTRFVARRGGVAAEGELRRAARAHRYVAAVDVALVVAHICYLLGFAEGRATVARDVTPRMWRRLAALLSLKAVADPSFPQEVLDPRFAVAATSNRGGGEHGSAIDPVLLEYPQRAAGGDPEALFRLHRILGSAVVSGLADCVWTLGVTMAWVPQQSLLLRRAKDIQAARCTLV